MSIPFCSPGVSSIVSPVCHDCQHGEKNLECSGFLLHWQGGLLLEKKKKKCYLMDTSSLNQEYPPGKEPTETNPL